MKFKRFLIIFLCVALLAAFSVSCFATDATTVATTLNYGFYISPGDYVFNEVLTPFVAHKSIYFDFLSSGVYYSGIDIDFVSYEQTPFGTMVYFLDSIVYYNTSGWYRDSFRYITVLDGFYIYDIDVYQWWQSNVIRVSPGYNSNLFDNMLSVFTAIGQWISGAAANLTSMFFVDNSLTFVGTLSVAALSMAVVFLIIGLISRFLRFKA